MEFMSIARVGVELEGGWNRQPENASYHRDGSVSITEYTAIVGEQVSAPMSTWDDVATWVTAAYPQYHNASCGMHVHVSFKSKRDYTLLMTREFYAYFTQRIEAWGKRANLPPSHLFWKRLAGFNRYCAKIFNPDAQVVDRRKGPARYAQLNYCFRLHGTIECRLFPVFKQTRIAVSAVQELLSIYEDYLREHRVVESIERVDDLA